MTSLWWFAGLLDKHTPPASVNLETPIIYTQDTEQHPQIRRRTVSHLFPHSSLDA